MEYGSQSKMEGKIEAFASTSINGLNIILFFLPDFIEVLISRTDVSIINLVASKSGIYFCSVSADRNKLV